ncbi:MAG: DNA polymerase [Candidatus Jordarchaeaceae archaeon]
MANAYDRALNLIEMSPVIAIDTETTGLAWNSTIVGISVAIDTKTGFYFPINHKNDNITEKQKERLKRILASPKKHHIYHNFYFDAVHLIHNGFQLPPFDIKNVFFDDTKIMAYLINPSMSNGLGSLGEFFDCDNQKGNLKELLQARVEGKKRPKKITFDELDVSKATEYSVTDAKLTFELYEIFDVIFNAEENRRLKEWYKRIELPLAMVLTEMTLEGIKIDVAGMKILVEKYYKNIQEIKEKIYSLANEKFNINSPKQLAIILFKKMGLQPVKRTQTGQFSTDTDSLTEIEDQHEIIKHVLEYRKLNKLYTTYLTVLPNKCDERGRVHTTFHQTVTVSGRLSSSEPNLQNIPRNSDIRSCFVPDTNKVFIVGDYSQIELRVAAYLSNDKAMYDAFLNKEDLHEKVAASLFKNEKDQKEARNKAKVVNFGILYGMGASALSKVLKISKRLADNIIKKYFEIHPEIKKFNEDMFNFAKNLGFVETISGRRRFVPEVYSMKEEEVSFGKRVCINTPVQGSAADLIKIAMVQLYHELKQTPGAKILVQIHDELIVECSKQDAERIKDLVKKQMTQFWLYKIPKKLEKIVEAGVSICDTWSQKQ